MNKRMRELLAQMREKQTEAENHMKANNKEKFDAAMAEINALKAAYESEKAIYELEKDNVPDDAGDKAKNKVSGFSVIAKMLNKKSLNDAENALIVDGVDGENYLIPEDVDTSIKEARESYIALKELTSVYPTSSISGSNVYAADSNELLDDFSDGDDITEATNPKFTQKKWTISFFGKVIPISNILMGAEKAGLMGYINNWFVKQAVKTENAKIIEALKKDKSPVEITGIAGIKKQINTAIDADYLIDGVIVTNTTGFDMLDCETDAIGRPLLNTNPANPTQKMLAGLPIIRISDAELPNDSDKAPIFIGSLKSGIAFHDFSSLQFSVSEHFFFGKNQTALRVIEGFAVDQQFADAYVYGLLSAGAEKVVTTKAKS